LDIEVSQEKALDETSMFALLIIAPYSLLPVMKLEARFTSRCISSLESRKVIYTKADSLLLSSKITH